MLLFMPWRCFCPACSTDAEILVVPDLMACARAIEGLQFCSAAAAATWTSLLNLSGTRRLWHTEIPAVMRLLDRLYLLPRVPLVAVHAPEGERRLEAHFAVAISSETPCRVHKQHARPGGSSKSRISCGRARPQVSGSSTHRERAFASVFARRLFLLPAEKADVLFKLRARESSLRRIVKTASSSVFAGVVQHVSF